MKKLKSLRKPFIFTLILLPIAFVGGWFTGVITIPSLDDQMLEQMQQQGITTETAILSMALSAVMYAVICGFFGYIIADKLGLIRSFRFAKKETFVTLLFGAAAGIVLCADAFTFAKWIPELQGTYDNAGSFDAPLWIASILYGGVLEEVMMRLFFMSLIALIGWKLFFRKEETVPVKVLVAANIIAAAAFAAGHLPATSQLIGAITPMLVFRCFLMNGAFGIVFGYLYRKFGIQYAMAAHMIAHIVGKTILLIVL